MRHTAGLTYEFLAPSAVRRRYSESDLASRQRSNAEQVALLATLPLQRQPGSAWEYSRATDVLARVVEVLAGRPLGEHLRQALFEPLEMADTGFHVPADRHDRMAEAWATDPDSGEAVTLLDLRAPAPLQSGGDGLGLDHCRLCALRAHAAARRPARALAHPRAQDGRVHDQRSPRLHSDRQRTSPDRARLRPRLRGAPRRRPVRDAWIAWHLRLGRRGRHDLLRRSEGGPLRDHDDPGARASAKSSSSSFATWSTRRSIAEPAP